MKCKSLVIAALFALLLALPAHTQTTYPGTPGGRCSQAFYAADGFDANVTSVSSANYVILTYAGADVDELVDNRGQWSQTGDTFEFCYTGPTLDFEITVVASVLAATVGEEYFVTFGIDPTPVVSADAVFPSFNITPTDAAARLTLVLRSYRSVPTGECIGLLAKSTTTSSNMTLHDMTFSVKQGDC